MLLSTFAYAQQRLVKVACFIQWTLPVIKMRLRYLFIFCLILQACSPEKDFNEGTAIKYFYVDYHIELLTEVQLIADTIEYLVSISDSVYTLQYINQKDSQLSDTVSYILKQSADFEPRFLMSGKPDKPYDLVYVDNRDFRINDKIYPVFKYASNTAAIDGCITHFWTPEFGIILTRSATWKSFSKLQTNSDSINKEINLLSEVIYQETSFYNGCTEEMELMQKDDAQKFYQDLKKGL